jgi:glycosyltransferase involved in cell wall biosynthesis
MSSIVPEADSAPSAAAKGATERVGLAYVVHSLHPGGTEKLVVEMALAFSEEFRVHVFCLDEPGHWAGVLRQRGIPVHCLWRQPGVDLRVSWRLANAVRQVGAQVIHAHQCTPWFYAALARLLYGAPRLLLEEHGRFYPEQDRPLRRLVNRLVIARLTHRFVAVSEDVKARLTRYEGVDSGRIEVIYNGVRPQPLLGQEARAALRDQWGFAPGDFVVGTAGRFDPIKNLPMLVRALAQARATDGRIRGMLIGDGPEHASIRALVEQMDLGEAIRLPGFRDDARALVQCMDLFVLSSLSEGTSMALLEAMHGGVPVAVTNVGGNPEIVVPGETGWIVESGATESLARTMVEAAANPERCRALAQAALRRLDACFTFDRMIAGYRSLYRGLIPRANSLGHRAASEGVGA